MALKENLIGGITGPCPVGSFVYISILLRRYQVPGLNF